MKNKNKDTISESSDIDSDNSLETSEINESKIGKSSNPDLGTFKRVSENGSEGGSKNNYSVKDTVHKNAKNQCRSLEVVKTISTELSKKDVYSENSASVNSIFSFEDLTSDDEIYMFQCPAIYKDVLYKNINNIKQSTTNKTKSYQFELIKFKKKCITLALPHKSSCGTLVKLPLKGHIIVNKVVETCNSNHSAKEKYDCSAIIFPQDIKIRHPLLGVDWDAHMKEANETLETKSCKKKNKKNKKEEVIETKNVFKKLKREGSKMEHFKIKYKKYE